MNGWCPKCGTYHELNTAGTCPEILEDKIFLGTYGEGHDVGYRAGVEAGKAERDKLLEEVEQLRIDVRDWKGLADRTATAIVEYGAMREKAEDRAETAEAERDKLAAEVEEDTGVMKVLRRRVEAAEIDRDRQRRSRKWALKKAKEWRENANLCWSAGEMALADVMYEAEQIKAERDKLREALRLMLAAIPDGWEVPLLYGQIVAQCRAALEEKP